MLDNVAQLKVFIKKQLTFFMEKLVDHNKLFIPDRYDILSQKPASSENMVNDLGDYIQYLYAADSLLCKYFEKDIIKLLTWTFNQKSYHDFLSIKKSVFDSTIDTGDFLVGLNCMLHSEIDEDLKNNVLRTIDTYLCEFYPENLSNISSLRYKGIKLPVFYCYSIYNDIEELVYIFEYTKDEKYLSKAKELYDFVSDYKINNIPTIASVKYLNINHLLSHFGLNFYTTILSKTMTNYCSASINLSRYDKAIDIQEMVVSPLIENFYDKNKKRFSTIAHDHCYQNYNLGQNHPALSLFVDYDFNTDFDYLDVIDDIISENEDFPLHSFEKKSIHLDSIVDFATILIKLYDKTKNERYLGIAQKYLKYIDVNFRSAFGFFVQGDNRNKLDTVYSTKFQSLLLKPYILLFYVLNGKSVFNEKFLYLLSRDR